jgi:hypothetical protein
VEEKPCRCHQLGSGVNPLLTTDSLSLSRTFARSHALGCDPWQGYSPGDLVAVSAGKEPEKTFAEGVITRVSGAWSLGAAGTAGWAALRLTEPLLRHAPSHRLAHRL